MELPCKYNSGLDDTFLEVVENNDHDLNFLVIRRARRESEHGLSLVVITSPCYNRSQPALDVRKVGGPKHKASTDAVLSMLEKWKQPQ